MTDDDIEAEIRQLKVHTAALSNVVIALVSELHAQDPDLLEATLRAMRLQAQALEHNRSAIQDLPLARDVATAQVRLLEHALGLD